VPSAAVWLRSKYVIMKLQKTERQGTELFYAGDSNLYGEKEIS